jgi:hypothetical protein
VYSTNRNIEPEPAEPNKNAENIWADLEPHLRARALRLLSDLCYAYVTTQSGESSTVGAKKEPTESLEN